MSKDQLRSSQVVTTFGPGAMVDLPNVAIMVSGLDNWSYDQKNIPFVEEPRLIDKLRRILGVQNLTLGSHRLLSRTPVRFILGLMAGAFRNGLSSSGPRQPHRASAGAGSFISTVLMPENSRTETEANVE